MDNPIDAPSRSPARVLRRSAGLAAALVLASCKLDLNPPPPPPPAASLPSWRVVVWGSDDGTNDRVRRAVIAELVRRHLAGRIETGVHGVDHVLDVSIEHVQTEAGEPPFFVAAETVTEGHDAAFTPERSFRTDAPDPSTPHAVTADPVASLAFAIGAALARTPFPSPSPPVVALGSPGATTPKP